MSQFPKDIFTEPKFDPDTLKNLGPLRPMAGIWTGARGLDVHPEVDGSQKQAYIEHYELQPIDPQTNGPQLLYGLRYHVHITKPREHDTFHDQVGYWLWEPAEQTVIHTLTIPRGQVLMAAGHAAADATSFELTSELGSPHYSNLANPFLHHAFRTTAFRIKITINPDGTWSYEQSTVLHIAGQSEPFDHTDRNTLKKLAEPTPNPMAGKIA